MLQGLLDIFVLQSVMVSTEMILGSRPLTKSETLLLNPLIILVEHMY